MSRRKKTAPEKLDSSISSTLSWHFNDGDFSSPSTSNNLEDSKSPIIKKVFLNISDEHIVLGKITFDLPKPVDLNSKLNGVVVKYSLLDETIENLTLEFSYDSNDSMLVTIPETLQNIINQILSHNFHWIYNTPDTENSKTIQFSIAILTSKLPLHNATNLIEFFFGVDYAEYKEVKPEINLDFESFFKEIKMFQENEVLEDETCETKSLIPTIRPYQVNAIRWMLKREKCVKPTSTIEYLKTVYDEFQVENRILYFNKFSGVLTLCPVFQSTFPSGGILADEMGLGKTVEFIGCILNNPRDVSTADEGDYLCPILNEEEPNAPQVKLENENHTSEVVAELTESNLSVSINETKETSNEVTNSFKGRRRTKTVSFKESESSDEGDVSFGRRKSKKQAHKGNSRRSSNCSYFESSDDDYIPPKEPNDSSDFETSSVRRKKTTSVSRKRKQSFSGDAEDSECESSLKHANDSGDEKKHHYTSFRKRRRRRKSKAEKDPRDTIHERVERGSVRKVLNEWYEKLLSEYSTVKPKRNERKLYTVKCVCGDDSDISDDWIREGYVRCSKCETFQHVECVNHVKNYVYFCPTCWNQQLLIKSSATLIIAPTAICDQWLDEINKHVKQDTLNILMYEGVSKTFIQPSVMSSYDVVITSYNILKTEVYHTSLKSRKLRNEERFLKTCTPLTRIEWWRLCLDEAQMVEGNATKTNQMANLIQAVNRWSVTGTPIQKSLNDLFYLIEYLRVDPFFNRELWNGCLYTPYLKGHKSPLLSIMSQVFWRNSKTDVYGEIELPDQITAYHMLRFNAVEEHFYNRLHSEKCSEFIENIRKYKYNLDQTLKSLNKQSLTKLLHPLLNLRQACSHPQAVRGVFANKGCMTREKLHDYLLNKTKVETEEWLRKYISALNGVAGIHCIKESWNYAVECYRTVLRLNEEFKNKIEIDSLQVLHTLYNLAEVMEDHSEGIPPTLRDSKLRDESTELEKKYLEKKDEDMKQSETQLLILTKKVNQHASEIRSTDGWWARIIHIMMLDGMADDLIDKITYDLDDNYDDKNSVRIFSSRVSSLGGIECTLRPWVDSLDKNRRQVVDHLTFIKELTRSVLAARAVECHLRPTFGTKRTTKCELCKCEKKLLDYECQLFDVSMKKRSLKYEKVMDGIQTKGWWRFHKCELIFRSILNFARPKISSGIDNWCLDEGNSHIKMLEVMKKEFKQMRAVWMELNHMAQAEDELAMSKLRLRLKLPGEVLPPKTTSNLSLKQHDKIETIHIIEAHTIEYQGYKLSNEAKEAESEFKKKHGTLIYLENIGKKENAKPDPCPVCHCQLESKWCVLQCGHSYCLECTQSLSDNAKTMLKCPVCREITPISGLCFIDLTGREEESETEVKGSHPTKVESVVRTVLDLKKMDENVKVVIFSTWEKVLNVLAHSLAENHITFKRMPGYKYQEQLKEFKDPNSKITALLLPIAWGSKGLNIIEATHLFLVEPIMNPAEELQAISRIHRIGQTKETTVHRFLVKGTIEENIQSANDKWEERTVTVKDLKQLFTVDKLVVS